MKINWEYEIMAWKQIIYIKIIKLLEKLKIVKKDKMIEYLKHLDKEAE